MTPEIKKITELVENKIFTAQFVKKDGTIRRINCRLGVKKHLKGGEIAYNPSERGYLTVYDVQNKGYRMLNLNTLLSLTIDGITYEV